MKSLYCALIVLAISLMTISDSASAKAVKADKADGAYAFTMKTIDGKEKHLSDYKGKVALVVNVASFCGFTKQYAALEELYERYKNRGFVILAFPANNFGSQEPGTNEEIKNFCSANYNVTFDLFSKISVKGPDQDPFYKYLTTESGFNGDIEWNFTKFLVDRHGTVSARYKSKVTPTDSELVRKLEDLLAAK